MSISSAKAVYGLSAVGTPTSTGVSGTVLIGTTQSTESYSTADVAYVVRAIFATAGDDLVLNFLTGSTAGSTAFVAGAAQVEKATIVAAGGCTSNGTMTLVVTAADMTGSPKNVDVALTTTAHTTATLIASAAATALAADTDVAAIFSVTSSGAEIILTRKPTSTYTVPGGTLNLYAANDATINVNIPGGLGVTAAASSANTAAGVVSSGTKIYDGDGLDFEGTAIATITYLRAVLIENNGVNAIAATGITDSYSINAGNSLLIMGGTDVVGFDTTPTFSPSDPSDITITVIGSTV